MKIHEYNLILMSSSNGGSEGGTIFMILTHKFINSIITSAPKSKFVINII